MYAMKGEQITPAVAIYYVHDKQMRMVRCERLTRAEFYKARLIELTEGEVYGLRRN